MTEKQEEEYPVVVMVTQDELAWLERIADAVSDDDKFRSVSETLHQMLVYTMEGRTLIAPPDDE